MLTQYLVLIIMFQHNNSSSVHSWILVAAAVSPVRAVVERQRHEKKRVDFPVDEVTVSVGEETRKSVFIDREN